MSENKTTSEAANVMDLIYHFLYWIYQLLSAIGMGDLMEGITDKFANF